MCPSYLDGDQALVRAPGDTRVIGYCAVFKVREEAHPTREGPGAGPASRRRRAGLSKLNSMQPLSAGPTREARRATRQVRSTFARPVEELDSGHRATGTRPRRVLSRGELPRKEVIQPQLPLRLPCYDFTPVTNPTFDGSLPCGLGHRLRVLPASVV